MDVLSITPEYLLKNEGECLECIKNQWNSIPLLNANDLQDLRDKKMVRFCGMIQDMFNPEYFFEKYEIVNETSTERSIRNGKYLDVYECKETEIFDHESINNVTSERQTLIVISVPGLNEWVENMEKEQFEIHRENITNNDVKKRPLDEDNEAPQTANNENTKRQCTTSSTQVESLVVSHEHLLNFPLPQRDGKVCQIKVYKDIEQMKLNEMIEVVGFLSVNPILTAIDRSDYCSEIEIQTHNPPPSLIPRIHCVMWRKLQHNNPLVGKINIEDKIQTLKKDLHIVLTQLLMGDSLAAEYLMYHLMSEVYLRTSEMPLGKLSLNISQVPAVQIPDYGENLYELIQTLVPKSHYLPMILENMNNIAFIPKKDYECDRVTTGVLQLSNNTHLVLDETKLMPGRLNESGVKAVNALSNTIKNQKVSYDFQYYPMEFDCDIPILILSEGKSLLPSDFHVPLKPDVNCLEIFHEVVEAAKHFLQGNLLNELRVYLTSARYGKYELAENVQDLVQNEFVRMRQTKNVTPDDLHQLLVIARLVCLSEGKTSLDGDSWKTACHLEEERKKRLTVP